MSLNVDKFLETKSENLGLGGFESHIFLCVGDKCISSEEGLQVWDFLKAYLKDNNLDKKIFRSKAGCLRVCGQGVIALTYPSGNWYHNVTKELVKEIVDTHLVEKKPFEKNLFATNPLGN